MKPSIPKGMRDFTSVEVAKRSYIFDTIKSVFKLYGYNPIETPTMENLSSLLGKYGNEGDKLLFKVLNSGDFTNGINFNTEEFSPSVLSTKICEKGLRYDLTVPFARYVVQHQNELSFPFKRYQIQPVWRADRPQKGRYREFYQCDVDVVGSPSLLYEAELVQIVEDVFGKLNINVELKINNRKVLSGIAEYIGHPDKIVDITVAIDKLDKIGFDGVKNELLQKGLSVDDIDKLYPVLTLSGSTKDKLLKLREILSCSQEGMKGIEEMEELFSFIGDNHKMKIDLDLSLARGLSYYTGAIFEVKALDYQIGSISGGGRYDNLTGIFGMPGLSGVGISFGADRIYDVMTALNLFPESLETSTLVLFANFGKNEALSAVSLAKSLREAAIPTEVYPSNEKLKKQFDWAEKKSIRYIVFIGENEISKRIAVVKDIIQGIQEEVSFDNLVSYFISKQQSVK